MKELQCSDLGYDCEAVVRGETVEDVLAQAGPHVKEVHGLETTPETTDRLRTLIRDA